MPIFTLRFKLPDEKWEADCARQGADLRSAVCEVDQFLRNKVKYGLGPDDAKTPEAAFEEVRDLLWAELNERGIDIFGD